MNFRIHPTSVYWNLLFSAFLLMMILLRLKFNCFIFNSNSFDLVAIKYLLTNHLQ